MTVVARATVEVAVPVDWAWQLITSWERQGEWMPLTEVWSEDGDRVGGRLFARTGIGRLAFLDTMDIIRIEPPRVCEVRHTGHLVRGRGVFLVEAADNGRSRVTWEEHLDLPKGPLGRAGWLLVRPFVALGLHVALRRFARLGRAAW
jgi:carbon monoxide dehydrogenase subunit G